MPVIKMRPTSPGTRFRVKLDKSHLWKGGPFEPLTGGTATFHLRDLEGVPPDRLFTFFVRMVPDRIPTVRASAYGVSSVVTPDARIPLRIVAEDDYRVTALGVAYSTAGRAEESGGEVEARSAAGEDDPEVAEDAEDAEDAEGTPDELIAASRLATWRVRTGDSNGLAEKLRAIEGVTQVVPFGRQLHVSGPDTAQLAARVEPVLKAAGVGWERGVPRLEDVFINLMGGAEQ